MVYVTGDTHGDYERFNDPFLRKLDEDDTLIICGDFGLRYCDSAEERYWLKWLDQKPWTTLWIDGNHENFDMLYNLPTVEFCGGIAHKVDDGIFHLIRGEAYNIDGKKFFVFASGNAKRKRGCAIVMISGWI